MVNKGYIYIRDTEPYNLYGVIKLGRTKNIVERDSVYKTGEYVRGKMISVYEILIKQKYDHIDDIYVEKLLQRYFTQNHKIKNGGTEFYDKKIVKEVEEFLNKTIINYKKLTDEEIDNLFFEDKLKVIKNLIIKKNNNKLKKEEKIRNELQDKYSKDILEELENKKRVFIKAPTGFGKTHLYFQLIKKILPKKILVLTPRILLNRQIVDIKYSKYIFEDNYKIIHFSDEKSNDKIKIIENISKDNDNKYLITSCYQSGDTLLNLIKEYKVIFDFIIFDEAHYITSWKESEFLINNNIVKYRILGSATPTEEIILNPQIFGKVVEKVKVYELINFEILCNIVTLIKQIDSKKSEYHNLKDLIVNGMIKYQKKKGIIYVNCIQNAENLYNLMKTQNEINTYIYVSGDVLLENETDDNINTFESDKKPAIIIVVGKLGYGYDHPLIDFIALADPRQSDIDIRQILGRGLRWNKEVYPNKLLHLLVPLYRNEFGEYSEYGHLKKYLDYIIGECGQDIIIKSDGTGEIKGGAILNGKEYDGEKIPLEILNDYCTTGYNKFTDFVKFLRVNKVYSEIEYNELREKQTWMCEIGKIREKYPKFCFQDININNLKYYWTREEADIATEKANLELSKKVSLEIYRRYTVKKLKMELIKIDNKIILTDFDLYYPIKNNIK